MTDIQFQELQKSLSDIRDILVAGFSTLAGMEIVNRAESNTGMPLETPEYFSRLHDGLDAFLMLLNNNSRQDIDDLLSEESKRNL